MGHRHGTKHVYRSAQLTTWSIEAQENPWNKTGGMTPWMASTASAGAIKSGESETTPPIIARLHNALLARHLKINSRSV